MLTNDDILRAAMRQSAYDSACAPEDFLRAENVFVESKPSAHAHRYLELPFVCNITSYGTNAVISARADLLPALRAVAERAGEPYALFETPALHALNGVLAAADAKICFMADYFLPDVDAVFAAAPPCAYLLRVLDPADFAALYLPAWENALCAARKDRDALAVGAYDGAALIALAGCSADAEGFWQIGVDVLPAYRRRGIASALTNALARETFSRGNIPFYCAAWSNIRSVKNALRAGFKPGWVEVTAKPAAFVDGLLVGSAH